LMILKNAPVHYIDKGLGYELDKLNSKLNKL